MFVAGSDAIFQLFILTDPQRTFLHLVGTVPMSALSQNMQRLSPHFMDNMPSIISLVWDMLDMHLCVHILVKYYLWRHGYIAHVCLLFWLVKVTFCSFVEHLGHPLASILVDEIHTLVPILESNYAFVCFHFFHATFSCTPWMRSLQALKAAETAGQGDGTVAAPWC